MEPITAWIITDHGDLVPAGGSNDPYLSVLGSHQHSAIVYPEPEPEPEPDADSTPGADVQAAPGE